MRGHIIAVSPSGVRVPIVLVAVLAAAVVGLLVLLMLHVRSSAADGRVYAQPTQPPASVAVPTAAFVGDSYSSGAGSTGFDSRFTTLVSAYEGWAQQNFAYGGTGYLRTETANRTTGCEQKTCPNYQGVIDRVQASDPNIVVVSGGRNDVGLPEGDVDEAITQFYMRLREAVPDARIIVTSPLWAYGSPPAQLASITQSVRRAADQIDATYLDLGEPLVQNRALVSGDRVHPNDAGHAEIARLLEVALSRASAATPAPTPTAASTSTIGG